MIGTYRQHLHVQDALQSLEDMVEGVEDIIFIDDSGSEENAAWLRQYGAVVTTPSRGYTTAMQMACVAAEGQECFWLEEDFTFIKPVSLDHLSEMLFHRPWLAQVVLQRGPHYEVEHRHGGIVESRMVAGDKFVEVSGVIEHTAFFSCNPTVIRGSIWQAGWPDRKWSEEAKGHQVVEMGYRFGLLPDISVEHHGEHLGTGY